MNSSTLTLKQIGDARKEEIMKKTCKKPGKGKKVY